MEGTRKLLLAEKINEVANFEDAKESMRDFLLQILLLLPHFLENILAFLAEKVNQVLLSLKDFLLQILLLLPHFLENTWVFLADKLNQVLPSIRDFLLPKVHLLLHLLENSWGFLAEKLNQILPPETRSLLLQKLHLLLHLLENIWGFLAEKLNQVLPPETRSHWVHVGITLVLPVALSLLCLYYLCNIYLYNCLYCCYNCLCKWLCRCFKWLCNCCCRGTGKIMKAPGRSGEVMLRALFEGNPRGYFLSLRANKPLVF